MNRLSTILSEAPVRDFTTILQKISVVFLGVVALACIHALLYHLHAILAPFVLAGFLVFAVQPSVEMIYAGLAGLSPPYRWCCCCGVRRWRRRRRDAYEGKKDAEDTPSDAEDEEVQAAQILLAHGEDTVPELMLRLLDGICRFVAVSFVLGMMILTLMTLVSLLARGAFRVKENWNDYRQGMMRMTTWLDHMKDIIVTQLKLSGKLEYRLKMVYTNVLSRFQDLILDVVNTILGAVTGGVFFMFIVVFYMLFWLLQPLPIGGKASKLVHSYIWKKTLVSFLYGSSVGVMFHLMGIDLAAFFGLVTIFLNYVPEVGALIAMIVPIPVILLDGKQNAPFLCLTIATIGQAALKFMFGNILELRLIQDDKEMRIHPVWVLLGLNYFGFIWGPVGMLISVPLMAMMKSLILQKAEEMEEVNIALYAQDFLACLEGRKRTREKQEIARRSLLPLSTPGPLAEATPDMTPSEASEKDELDQESATATSLPKRPRPEAERRSTASASGAPEASEDP